MSDGLSRNYTPNQNRNQTIIQSLILAYAAVLGVHFSSQRFEKESQNKGMNGKNPQRKKLKNIKEALKKINRRLCKVSCC